MGKVDKVAVFLKPHHKLTGKEEFSLSSSFVHRSVKIFRDLLICLALFYCSVACSCSLLQSLQKFSDVMCQSHKPILLTDVIHVETHYLFRLLLSRHSIHQMMICEFTIIIFKIPNEKGNNYTWWKRELWIKPKTWKVIHIYKQYHGSWKLNKKDLIGFEEKI